MYIRHPFIYIRRPICISDILIRRPIIMYIRHPFISDILYIRHLIMWYNYLTHYNHNQFNSCTLALCRNFSKGGGANLG